MGIQIGENFFTENTIQLNIKTTKRTIKAKLEFADFKPWPVEIASPGAMGWYAFVPFMECFHEVVSLDHTIQGMLSINNKNILFDNGRGYIEKDWGRSFSIAYIWIQSNHFENL